MSYTKLFLILQSEQVLEASWEIFETSQLQIIEWEPQGQARMPVASPIVTGLCGHSWWRDCKGSTFPRQKPEGMVQRWGGCPREPYLYFILFLILLLKQLPLMLFYIDVVLCHLQRAFTYVLSFNVQNNDVLGRVFIYSLLQNIEYNFLCYTVNPCCLPILCIVVCIC